MLGEGKPDGPGEGVDADCIVTLAADDRARSEDMASELGLYLRLLVGPQRAEEWFQRRQLQLCVDFAASDSNACLDVKALLVVARAVLASRRGTG